MSPWQRLRLAVPFLAAVLPLLTVQAADLIEPWEKGFSNLEAFASRANDGGGTGLATLAGFGAGGGVSLGVGFSDGGDGVSRLALIGFWSSSLGGRIEVDVIGEYGSLRSGEDGADLGHDWMAGMEASLHGQALVPYLRAIAFADPEIRGFCPLAGLMIPAGERLEMHVELAAEALQDGSRLLSLGLGPNVRVGPGLELLPEVAAVRESGSGLISWQVSLGLVLDPRRPLRRALRRRLAISGSAPRGLLPTPAPRYVPE